MNHYPHHIGDYLKDTAHLSLLEHGCYRRMLDVYYSREKPFADAAEACKLIGARSAPEKAAVQSVLSDYFSQGPDGWHQKRCDQELTAYAAKAKANRENGKKGGRPVTETEPTNNPSGFSSLTQNNLNQNQEPEPVTRTNNQKPKKTPSAAFAPPEWVDSEKWNSWIAIRPAKARTPESLKAAVEKLDGFRAQGHDPNAIIANSLANGWQGLFPPDRNATVTENLSDFMARRDATRAAS